MALDEPAEASDNASELTSLLRVLMINSLIVGRGIPGVIVGKPFIERTGGAQRIRMRSSG